MGDRYIAIRCKICGDYVILSVPYTWRDVLKHRCYKVSV